MNDLYDVNKTTGCWIWKRAMKSKYGTYNNKPAHRYMYEELVEPIEDNKHLHHLCEETRCVNPDHLVPVTPQEHRELHKRMKAAKEANLRLNGLIERLQRPVRERAEERDRLKMLQEYVFDYDEYFNDGGVPF